jgi:MFS family permease
MQDAYPSNFKWYMLALLTATGTFVSAIPFSCMPVLFKEISEDLGLSLVQIGTIWGTASLAGVFVSLIAGVLSDRFGLKFFLSVSCILVGVTGALRGLSNSFLTLMVTVFINGIVRLMIPISVTKTVGMWFKGNNLGMAMGIAAMGMGLGLMLGPMISATILSPLLGGWRSVLYLYGAISVIVGILWF